MKKKRSRYDRWEDRLRILVSKRLGVELDDTGADPEAMATYWRSGVSPNAFFEDALTSSHDPDGLNHLEET